MTPARLALPLALLAAAAFPAAACAGEIPAEADLGAMLFFDPNFSAGRSMSCATCHAPDTAFTDARETSAAGMASLGDDGRSFGGRNAPTAAYAAAVPAFHYDPALKEYVGGLFLDGRAATLADQAVGPPLNPGEMAMPSAAAVIARLRENPDYEQAFRVLYGPAIFDNADAAFAAFGRAIAAYEATDALASYDSRYDRYLRGEYDLTPLEDLGRTLFFSNNNVNCATCHSLRPEDAAQEPFSNHQYRNIGVPSNPALLALAGLPADHVDRGLAENPGVTDPGAEGRFRTPTLRNVAVTGPYMHNGVFRDLRTVIAFYDHFNNPDRALNPETGAPWSPPEVAATVAREDLKGQPLTERKIDALVAFLEALTDARYEPLLASGTP
ncbi:MAG: c-type cytochrome [Rhodobacteraceae bacterium]|jgi:cytochrome c peroxidase|nr:c-type cytochrome [Paracoccaceae bacterium]